MQKLQEVLNNTGLISPTDCRKDRTQDFQKILFCFTKRMAPKLYLGTLVKVMLNLYSIHEPYVRRSV
jgi:hypothetical protein